jgi:hypothetical protein
MAQATEYTTEFIVRFWARVARGEGEDACWPWAGPQSSAGYGAIMYRRVNRSTHRLAWELTNGAIPDGLWVLHRCDNPPCCNPAHLFLGTNADNVRDREGKRRGFFKKGQKNPWRVPPPRGSAQKLAKLTEATVLEMVARYRAGGVTQRALADEYGISRPIVSLILSGKRWPHVTRGMQ